MSSSLFTSCEWLDVKPEAEIYEEQMYSSEIGFQLALNGLYVKMASSSLYGRDLSWGAMEAWAHRYKLSSYYHKTFYAIQNREYDEAVVVSTFESIWNNSYKIIAEANKLIENLIPADSAMFKGDIFKSVILGEAYAIRGMLHFDLARIFGQSPAVDNGSGKYLPYVAEFGPIAHEKIATKEVIEKAIADLEEAAKYTAKFDLHEDYDHFKGVSSYHSIVENMSNTSMGDFYGARRHRLNYGAIQVILARAYLYLGNYEKVTEIYELIIGGKMLSTSGDITPSYSFGTNSSSEWRQKTEMLFGITVQELDDLTEIYYSSLSTNSYRVLKQQDIASLYEYYGKSTSNRANFKHIGGSTYGNSALPADVSVRFAVIGTSTYKDYVPLITVPELYLMGSEAYYKSGNPAKAAEVMNAFFKERGVNSSRYISETLTEEEFMERMTIEFRIESIDEGQLIFYYKRLNAPIIRSSTEKLDVSDELVPPTPLSEIV